jgi:hypothetical protein
MAAIVSATGVPRRPGNLRTREPVSTTADVRIRADEEIAYRTYSVRFTGCAPI